MKRDYGFSLIEILVVLVIMGLLISVVAPTCLLYTSPSPRD